MVEFALAALAFFLLIFGVIDFGRAAYEYNIIASSAREGARVAIIQGNTNANVLDKVVSSSANLVRKGAGTCTTLPCPVDGDITISAKDKDGNPTTTRTCTSTAVRCGTVTVSVSRTFRPVTPLIRQIVGNTLNLGASSTMVVER